MRKNIFLTSMLALVVASPAFADWPYGVGLTNDGQDGYIGALTAVDGSTVTAAACQATPLTYNGDHPGSGTFTFTADWTRDECDIRLDPNKANGGDASNDEPWRMLYSKYGIGAYLEDTRQNLMTTAINGLTSIPTGAEVTVTWNLNAPTGHNSSEISPNSISTSTARRVFNGFFSAASNGTKYIENTPVGNEYHITTGGDTAAKAVAKDSNGRCPETTWYAQWGCANISFPSDPALPGYEFLGWHDAATNGKKIGEICSTDLNLYAYWGKKSYNVGYKCMGGSFKSGISPWTGDDGSDSVTYDETVYNFRVPRETCEWSGHDITGWKCYTYTGIVGVEPWYDNQSNVWNVDDDVVCEAQWENMHNLTYVCGEGNGLQEGTSFATGSELTMLTKKNPGNCTVQEGQSFLGWTCDGYNDYDSDCGLNQDTCTITAPNGDITCTGNWEWNKINLKWKETEDATPTTGTCTYGSNANTDGGITVPTPTRTGYTFQGWIVTDHTND